MVGIAAFLLRRLAAMAFTVVCVTALAWLTIRVLRPDVFEGDERPLPVQLGDYLFRAFVLGDFGESLQAGQRPISAELLERLPADLLLLAGGLAFGLLAGMAGGLACAARPRAASSRILEALAVIAQCAPVYVIGFGLLLLFGEGIGAIDLGLSAAYVPLREDPLAWLGSMLAPWVVLGLPLAGVTLRMTRNGLLEVRNEEFLRTAAAKGLGNRAILRRHALPAAAAPVLTLTGVSLPIFVTNLVLVEQVFAIPGVFEDVNDAVIFGDFPLLWALTAVAAGLIALAGLAIDLALAWLDPRLR